MASGVVRRQGPSGPGTGLAAKLRGLPLRAGLVVYAIWALFPLYWLIRTSLVPEFDATSLPPDWFSGFNFSSYAAVLASGEFMTALLHSLIVASAVTVIAVVCGSLAGYGLTHLRRQRTGSGNYEFWVLSSRMAPPIAVALPLYFIYSDVHLEDTVIGLIIAQVAVVVGIITWIMIEAFRGIPVEITEAAEVDGCSSWGAFRRVAMPLAVPGAVGAATISFLLSWNEFLLALVLTNQNAKTAPLGLYQFIGYESLNLGQLAAASCLVLVPTVIVVGLFQRQLVTGLTFGAVKG
jgi:multiple sugar transport system permease protein